MKTLSSLRKVVGFIAIMSMALDLCGETVRVGNYVWHYRLVDGRDGVEIVNYDSNYYSPEVAVSPEPSGALTIPPELNGKPVIGIGLKAFDECSRISSVEIPASVEWIEEDAFDGCTAITNVKLSEGLKRIGNDAFSECPITNITLPASLEEIETPFAECAKLAQINVADGGIHFSSANGILFNKEGNRIVLYPNGRSGVYVVPDEVTEIADWAFMDCEKLTGVSLHANVSSVGEGAFSFCPGLAVVSVDAGNPYFKSVGGVLFSEDMSTLKCYPAGKKDVVAYTVPASVTQLDAGAFLGCGTLTSVILPHDITEIPEDAFADCWKLSEVVFGAYVEHIGRCAFEGTALKSVTIPYGVEAIEDDAFSCDGGPLRTAYVPQECELGDDVFETWSTPVNVVRYSVPGDSSAHVNTVRFDTSDGSKYPYDRQVFGGNPVGALPTPSREKYQFLGWFTASSGGTKVSASTKVTGGDVTYYAQWLYDGSAMVSAAVAAGQEYMGKVTGGGQVVKAGTKVALKAIAATGYVFAGWYLDGNPLEGAVDYRTASYSYVAPGETVAIEARFDSAESDVESLGIDVEENYTTEDDGTFGLDLGARVQSISIPKIAVAGLPSGLKFDTKSLVISGRTSKPGLYTVKVSLTNTSVKKAIVKEFTITVPNLSCPALPNLHAEVDAYRFEAGTAFSPEWVDCAAASADWKVTAAGLPAGLKFDAKTGSIVGVATKPGAYTVTFTAKSGKETQTATITLNIVALPGDAVGTFNGFVTKGEGEFNKIGSLQLTTTADGKITAKVVAASGTYSFSGTGWTLVAPPRYGIEMATKKGDKLAIDLFVKGEDAEEHATGLWYQDQVRGRLTLADGSQYEASAQKTAFGLPWHFKAEGSESKGWTLVPAADGKSADITVTVKDGATKLAGKIGGYSVSSAGFVNMSNYSNGVMNASFTPVVTVSKVKKVLVVDAELNFDHRESGGRAGFGN